MGAISVRTRLIGLGAAAVLAAAGVVGVATGAVAAPRQVKSVAAPVAAVPAAATATGTAGAWVLTTDWGCDGTVTGSFNLTFNTDGTWIDTSYGHSGRWFQVGTTVVFTFNDLANLVYSGGMTGSWFNGVQGYEVAGGATGCFGGQRGTSGDPAGIAPERAFTTGVDPVRGS